MPRWTPEQQEVIFSNAKTLFCSAAAGSGKTAVLVERVVRLIQEGEHPHHFLIVTFTTAAAAEMKEKIRKRLQELRSQPACRHALLHIDSMEISTIHSFCQRLIRQEFQAVEVDPLFQICSSGLRKRLFTESFRQACNILEEQEDPDFARFRKSYERSKGEQLVSDVHTWIMSLPDPLGWLQWAAEQIPTRMDGNHPWFQILTEMARSKLYSAAAILNQQYQMFDEYAHLEAYRDIWKLDSEMFHVKQSWLDPAFQGTKLTGKWKNLPALRNLNDYEIDWRDRYGAWRKKLKELGEEIDQLLMINDQKTEREFGAIRQDVAGLVKLVTETEHQFQALKKAHHVLDFPDLEHKALHILRTEPYGSSVRERYTQIFVDECQDVSGVQDAIIEQLHHANNALFMVGDVKQSIYRFRMADPTLFLGRMENARQAENPEEQCIFLQTNFRSRPEILETTNVIFRDVMRRDTAEMDYTDQEALRPGRETEGFTPVEVDWLREEEKEHSSWELVAAHLAERIHAFVSEKQYQYRDMVILMPAVSTHGEELANALEAWGIPVYFDGNGDFYQLPEVMAFQRLLEIVESPYQDEALLTTLKLAPFWFSDQELAEIRLCHMDQGSPFFMAFAAACQLENDLGIKCRQAQERLTSWRLKASVMRVSDLCWFLLEDGHRYAVARMEDRGEAAQANLRMLCEKARAEEENRALSLRDFLETLRDEAASGEQRAAVTLGEKDNLVRIMTIHKSKGLQFPVVFCAGLDDKLLKPGGTDIMMNTGLGLCLRYKEPAHRLSNQTVANQIFAWQKAKEERAERIRLLYVALTRAQERLILISCAEEKALWKMPSGSERVNGAETYMDLIMPALQDFTQKSTGYPQAETPWKIRVSDQFYENPVEKSHFIHNLAEWEKILLSTPPVENLWKYEEEKPVDPVPKKRSVTTLIRQAEKTLYGEEEEEETPETKRVPEAYARRLAWEDWQEFPAFMWAKPTVITGAVHGTIVHHFLSLARLEELRGGRQERINALERMKAAYEEKHIFSREEAREIRVEEIDRFYGSDLGQRVLRAEEVHREWNFNLLVEDERNMILQGVIDCAFREGNAWVILDYKTDRVASMEELLERYAPQLEWYARALERLTEIPVKEWWLYSLHLGEAIQVNQ